MTLKERFFGRHHGPSSWLLRRIRKRCWKKKKLSEISGHQRRLGVAYTTVDRQPEAVFGKLPANGDAKPSHSRHAVAVFAMGCRRFGDGRRGSSPSSFPFLSFPSFLHSLSPTIPLFLQQPSPSANPFLSTQFVHQIPPFCFIFFTLYTPTTSIHHHFLIFPTHSPNFTNQNPNPHFALSKNPAT